MRWSKSLSKVAREFEFRSIFRATFQKFTTLAIPNVLAQAMSYKHGFVKKCNGHKLCVKSRARKGGGFISPRWLAVSRASDAIDASGQMRHSASHPLTLGQPLYIDKATASQTRLTFARACVMVSSDEELPNDVSYRDLDGSTRKVKVSYSWKPQRCKVCLSFGHVNGACQQPSQKITQVYRPRQEPQHGVTTTNPSTNTPVPTVTMAEKMNEHSDSLGQRHEQEKDKSGLSSFPIISETFTAGASHGSHSPITTSPSRIIPSDNQEI
ncbi:hypothetical protein BHE74_00041864 [Ensete ventricosum]|nr:hypothetical protein BHE74_00041864 [Ensete ventricosum]